MLEMVEESKQEIVEMENKSNSFVEQAKNTEINNQQDLIVATQFAKQVKALSKKVKSYWKEPKSNAQKIHKSICEKEKEMLNPLTTAETILKLKIDTYNAEQERLREEEERKIQEERDRIALEELQRAEELRQSGDEMSAQLAEETAITMSEIKPTVENNVEKVEGLSFTRNYDIIITDPTIVPAYIRGFEIRPINLVAIKKVIRMSGNTVEIPRCCNKRNKKIKNKKLGGIYFGKRKNK